MMEENEMLSVIGEIKNTYDEREERMIYVFEKEIQEAQNESYKYKTCLKIAIGIFAVIVLLWFISRQNATLTGEMSKGVFGKYDVIQYVRANIAMEEIYDSLDIVEYALDYLGADIEDIERLYYWPTIGEFADYYGYDNLIEYLAEYDPDYFYKIFFKTTDSWAILDAYTIDELYEYLDYQKEICPELFENR